MHFVHSQKGAKAFSRWQFVYTSRASSVLEGQGSYAQLMPATNVPGVDCPDEEIVLGHFEL